VPYRDGIATDGDEPARKGWIEWGGGISDSKSPAKSEPCEFQPRPFK